LANIKSAETERRQWNQGDLGFIDLCELQTEGSIVT